MSRTGTGKLSWRALALILTGVLVIVAATPADADHEETGKTFEPGAGLLLLPSGADPWVPALWYYREDSLGEDRLEVWVCHQDDSTAGIDPAEVVSFIENEVVPWFDYHSLGRHVLKVTVGGVVESDTQDGCLDRAASLTHGEADVALVVTAVSFAEGLAWLRAAPGTFPENSRGILIDHTNWDDPYVIAHELGHTLQWQHINGSPDVMGARGGTGMQGVSAFFRYRAGWIDPSDVAVYQGGERELELSGDPTEGVQMLVIPTNAQFRVISVAARTDQERFDDLVWGISELGGPADYQGVEVIYNDYGCRYTQGYCHPDRWPTVLNGNSSGLWILGEGDRWDLSDTSLYADRLINEQDVPFDGVPVSIEVLSIEGDTVRIRLEGELPDVSYAFTDLPEPSGRFVDDDDSVFEADIEWLAEQGITSGCNPPNNDRFCPDDAVTRGQMAAFLARALDLTGRLDDSFLDDDDSIFEADVEKLAATGITRGCNPPVNDRFCPDDPVTRGAMAAFLVRALGYTDDGGGDLFVDDDHAVFEPDIDKLGTAGVTLGCNPPVNDRFCPDDPVTRGQMAAFLRRALGG